MVKSKDAGDSDDLIVASVVEGVVGAEAVKGNLTGNVAVTSFSSRSIRSRLTLCQPTLELEASSDCRSSMKRCLGNKTMELLAVLGDRN